MDKHGRNKTVGDSGNAALPVLAEHLLRDLSRLRSARGRLDQMLVNSYLGGSSGRLGQLQDAIRNDDTEEVRKQAHRWRGAAVSLGLTALAALLESIENDPGNARTQSTELPKATLEVEQALADYLAHSGT